MGMKSRSLNYYLKKYPELKEYDMEILKSLYNDDLLDSFLASLNVPKNVKTYPISAGISSPVGSIDKLEAKEKKKPKFNSEEEEDTPSARAISMAIGGGVALALFVVIFLAAMGYKYRKKILKPGRKSSMLNASPPNVRTNEVEPISPKPENKEV
ncbi:hypothetical protein TTRE_0000263501 [Trichuris trichiura]|uniref:Uncharacterized protein n=1 Tax=Trichuris trichiura TaxID=36087 RepID=A0A077Z6R5_TRITR|nr:hypothetical protein TTRE_0000263501 [Trichuris trichiura]